MTARLTPIVADLAEQMGREYAMSDPFGVSRAVFVAFFPKGRELGHDTLYLTFEPDNDGFAVRDYVNGHATHMPTVPVPADADAAWFRRYME